MTAQVTLIGNLVRDPELRFTAGGDAVANFTVAVNERIKDGNDWVDGETSYYDVTAWRKLGEQVAEHLLKGSRAIIVGKMKIEKYDAKDGTPRTKVVVTADEIGAAIRFMQAGNAPRPAQREDDDIPPF